MVAFGSKPNAGRTAARTGYAALLLAALINLAAVWVTEKSYDRLRGNTEVTLRTQQTLAMIERVRMLLVDDETGTRGYVLTGDTAYLAPARNAERDLPVELAALSERAERNAVQSSLMETVRTLAVTTMRDAKAVAELRRSEGFDAARKAIETGDKKLAMDTLRLTLDGMAQEEQRVRAARIDELRLDQHAIRLGIFAIALVNFLLVTIGAVFLWRDLMRRARESTALAVQSANLSAEVDARTAQLRELSHFLQNDREQEKAQVARELHDELGGALAAAKIDLQLLRERGPAAADAPARLDRISQALDEAVMAKRRIVEDLRPTLLDNLGINAALRWQCEQYAKRNNCPCNVRVGETDAGLSPEMSIAIYRIVQEALTNTSKYAQAKNVDVSLERDGVRWHLRVNDDGVGIDLAKQHHPTSHGLMSIRERARALGGDVRFSGGPGRGTTVDVWFPEIAMAGAVT
jgi:signal transduction histidine kinase